MAMITIRPWPLCLLLQTVRMPLLCLSAHGNAASSYYDIMAVLPMTYDIMPVMLSCFLTEHDHVAYALFITSYILYLDVISDRAHDALVALTLACPVLT